jgi:predicted MPP superfamily phosphohydrolase
MINSLEPDIILLPGDVVDEDIGPVIKQNAGELLRTLKAKYGVYAVTGNHEYIGGVEPSVEYLTEHGLIVLRDKTVKVADSFYIIGREDRASKGFAGIRRKPLNQLIEGVDKNLPVILMDHQPLRLEEAEVSGIDLQLSGHTHHGQLWPFNFITKKLYEVSMGYKQKGNTHYYVSCGVGSWGPPVRTGNRPEIVQKTLNFAA